MSRTCGAMLKMSTMRVLSLSLFFILYPSPYTTTYYPISHPLCCHSLNVTRSVKSKHVLNIKNGKKCKCNSFCQDYNTITLYSTMKLHIVLQDGWMTLLSYIITFVLYCIVLCCIVLCCTVLYKVCTTTQ